MFINSIYKTLNFQNSQKAFTCFHHYAKINMFGEISKHLKFMETHAGFCLGFFGWRGEVDTKKFLGLLRGSGGMLPQKMLKR